MKTLEEKAKEYADSYYHAKINYTAGKLGYKAGYVAAFEWIDTKELLPPYYKTVLIKRKMTDSSYSFYTAWLAVMDNGNLMFTLCGTNVMIGIEHIVGWRDVEFLLNDSELPNSLKQI